MLTPAFGRVLTYLGADATYGLHFITCAPVSAGTKIIACPAALVITKETAVQGLLGLGVDEAAVGALNERQLVSGYVALHLAVGLEKIRGSRCVSLSSCKPRAYPE